MKQLSLTPKLVFYNGCVHTVDSNDLQTEAIAVWQNQIMAVGTDAEILTLAGKETNCIDLKGRSLLPGIIDSHNHAWEAGRFFEGILTFGIRDFAELRQVIAKKLSTVPKGTWVQGGGWIETQFSENRMPTRWDLDAVSPDHPIVLERIFSTCVANSKALELAGITRDTPDPPDGEIGHDGRTGEPNGLFFRSAKMLIRRAMPGPFGSSQFGTGQGIEASVALAQDAYIRAGITGIVEPGVSPAICRAYQNMYHQDQLKIRYQLMPNWFGFHIQQEHDHMTRLIDELGFYTGMGNQWLRIGALKMAIDGGLTSRTAWNSWPYKGEATPRKAPLRLDISRLNGWVKKAHDAGWSVGIHVVGDKAQDAAVNAIYEAYKTNPVQRRHQIVHAYYPTANSLAKMHQAGIIAAVQPAFIYGEADGYPRLLPEEKEKTFLPLRTYLKQGVITAMSTDMPSAHYNPFWNLYAALTRKGMQGHQLGKQECITLDEALRMMTINSAYLTGEEAIKGSLEPGKLADFIVVNDNLNRLSPEAIRDMQVDMTVVDGKIIYKR